tara:strand:+ start:1617 stop:2429 length:813 start_codon:yes stop_codon:yes gene_type:complete
MTENIDQQYIILVDCSYYIFYRYHALKNWYSKAHPENKFDNPVEDEIFIKAYTKNFMLSIENLLKKNKIKNYSQLIFCRDCKRDSIWRNEHFKKYKDTRKHTSDIGQIFKYTYSNILPHIIQNNIYQIKSDNAEADDIVAVITQQIKEKYPTYKIIILANDHDYLQLVNSNVTILAGNNKKINDKSNGSAQLDLLVKIIMGDKSDNIPSCMKKCGIKTSLKFANNPELLNHTLNNNPDFKKQFEHNSLIIDFKNIPENIRNNIIGQYNNL